MQLHTELQQLCLVASAALLVYSNGLTGEFVVDDKYAIATNFDVKGIHSIRRMWSNDFWGREMKDSSHKSYRPLVILSFRITHYFWQDWTFPYHFTNVVLHVIVTCLFVTFCRKMIFIDSVKWRHGPIVAGLLFACHPVHVEAVTGIVGRAELMSAILVFAALFACRKSYFVTDDTGKADVKSINEHGDHDCKSSIEHKPNLSCKKHVNKISDKNGLDDHCKSHSVSKFSPDVSIIDGAANAGKAKSCVKRLKIEPTETSKECTPANTAAEDVKSMKSIIVCWCCAKLQEPAWLPTIAWTFVTIMLSCTAVLCKESGITVMGIAIACELVYRIEKGYCKNHPFKCLFSYRVLLKISLICASGCMMIYFRLWMNSFKSPKFGVGDNPAGYSGNSKTRFLTHSALPWINMWILIFPKFLCWDWCYGTIPVFQTFSDPRNIFTVTFYLSLFALMFYTLKCAYLKSKDFRPLALSLSLLVLPYIPLSNIFFLVGFTIAERCLYLPSAGYVILVTYVWCAACQRKPIYKRHFQVLLVTVLILYAARTVTRNRDWQTEVSLQRSAYAVNPNNARVASVMAGMLHYRENNRIEAESIYKKCVKLDLVHSSCYGGLGHIYALTNDTKAQKKAESLLLKGIELERYEHYTYTVLADLYYNTKEYAATAKVLIDMIRACGRYNADAVTAFATRLKNVDQLELAKNVIQQELCRKCNNDPLCRVPDVHMCNVDSLMALNVYMHVEWMLGDKDRAYKILRKNVDLRGGDFDEAKAIFSTIPAESIRKTTVSKRKMYSEKSKNGKKGSTKAKSTKGNQKKNKDTSKKRA